MTFSIKRRPFISRINRSTWTSPRWQHFQPLQNGSCYSSNNFLRRRRATQSKVLGFHFHTGFVFRDLELHSGLSEIAAAPAREAGRVGWLEGGWERPPPPKALQVLRAILTRLKTRPEPERKHNHRAGRTVGLHPPPVHTGEAVVPSELPEGPLREHDVPAYHLPLPREGGAARRCWALATTLVI